ncbi:HAD domain-containing protein [Hydrogenophaga sp.]|uniref:HAD domain-containing protein n=1 Tax=Hydrogenophaga sp. TaxID=1904254 RepID=UPI00391A0FB5
MTQDSRSPDEERPLEQSGNSRSNDFGPGVLFLDFDDVFCLNKPYGGYDLFQNFDERPPDLYDRLWHQPAVAVLLAILQEHKPRVVLTTSWLRMMERDGFEDLFRRTGLSEVCRLLHDAWCAPAKPGERRLDAIESWLKFNKPEGPFVVLDDEHSGTGLEGSWLDEAGCLVLCVPGIGLQPFHLEHVRRALRPGSGADKDIKAPPIAGSGGNSSHEVQAARLGRWLREQAERQSRTTCEISSSLGVSEASVLAVFSGDLNQSTGLLIAVANELGIQITLAPLQLPESWLYSGGPKVVTRVEAALQRLRDTPYKREDSSGADSDSEWWPDPSE